MYESLTEKQLKQIMAWLEKHKGQGSACILPPNKEAENESKI